MKTFDAKNTQERLETLLDPKVFLEDIRAKLLTGELNSFDASIQIQNWKAKYLR